MTLYYPMPSYHNDLYDDCQCQYENGSKRYCGEEGCEELICDCNQEDHNHEKHN